MINNIFTFFDVGANDGSSMMKYATNPDNVIYAFEPNPDLVNKLKQYSETYKNYVVVDKAVSDYNGSTTFNITGLKDQGCSSLCEFSDNLDQKWYWGESDGWKPWFTVTDKINVEVLRLDKFIDDINSSGSSGSRDKIERIDYLHCDAQGQDLEVLFGLGKYIDIVMNGIIEMPYSHDTKLYKTQKYTMADACKFLHEKGFILSIKNNDYQNNYVGNEVNVTFTRPTVVKPEGIIYQYIPHNVYMQSSNYFDVWKDGQNFLNQTNIVSFNKMRTREKTPYCWIGKNVVKYSADYNFIFKFMLLSDTDFSDLDGGEIGVKTHSPVTYHTDWLKTLKKNEWITVKIEIDPLYCSDLIVIIFDSLRSPIKGKISYVQGDIEIKQDLGAK